MRLVPKSLCDFADLPVPWGGVGWPSGVSIVVQSPKSIRIKCLLLFLLGLVGLSLGLEREPTPLVLHVRVAGDIDSAAMVRELQDHLDKADNARFEGVLIELQAGRVREDLAWSLGAAIEDAGGPVWVWLTGLADEVAGPEQLELAVRGAGAWIEPGLDVEWDGPPESASLAPEGVDAERMMRERYSSLWVACERRGASTRLAEGLLRPSVPLRATRLVAGECALVEGPVAPGEDGGMVTLVEPVAGGTKGRIPPEIAAALKMVDGVENSARQVIRRALGEERSRGLRTERAEVESDLEEKIAEGHRLIGVARAEAALAQDVLRKRIESGLGRGAYDRAVRERARHSLVVVERGEAALRAFEAIAAERPEVLRTRAPVQADLPGVEETAAKAWAREIEFVRRGLAGTRADAMAQAEG